MLNSAIKEIVQKTDVDSIPLSMAAVWLYALRSDGRYVPLLSYIETRMMAGRLLKLLHFVDYVVRRCDLGELSDRILERIGRKLGLRVKRCPVCELEEKYSESDLEVLIDTLPVLQAIQKAYCAKKLKIPLSL
jgi:hypothetical protein